MRPVRLTIQAFGPFAGCEIVDFQEGVKAGLFGIYGQTGSGKSTVFSAMTFALFGEAAKPEQEAISLRSDHADPSLPTEVEFIFDIGERRFVVRRRPEQSRPKQRGTGETMDAHVAWLFDATGITVEEICAGKTGKIVAEKKVGAVREAVTDVLGYGAEQFRQIVLLPQGKFETFLTAKTDARLTILRELFDVSVYRRLAEKFKDEASAFERDVRQKREVCIGRVKTEGFESADALSQGIAEVQSEHQEAIQSEAEASQVAGDAKSKLDSASKLDALFHAAEKAKSELNDLEAKADDMHALKDRNSNVRRAQSLADVEGFLLKAAGEVASRADKKEEKLRLSLDADRAAKSAAGALNEERSRANVIDDLRRQGEELQRHQRTLVEASSLEEVARSAGAAHATEQGKLDETDRVFNSLGGRKRSQEQGLKLTRVTEMARGDHKTALLSLDAALNAAEGYEKAIKARDESNVTTGRLKAELVESISLEADAKARFDLAETNLAAAQALHLAAKLVDGEPCPVCGSSEHPGPANGTSENAGLDAAFRNAKKTWETAQKDRQRCEWLLASAEGGLKERQDRLAELPVPEHSATLLREKAAAVRDEIEALGDEVDIFDAERELAALDEELKEAEANRDAARSARDEAKHREGLARDRLEQALSTIPEGLRDKDVLAEAHASAQRDMAARRASLEAAEKSANDWRDAALAAKKDVEAATGSFDDAMRGRADADTEFRARLAKCDLTESQYQSFKPLIASIETDIVAVEEFERHLDFARKSDEGARAAIADCERPDLRPLKVALLETEEALKGRTDHRAQVGARLSHLQNVQSEIAEAQRQLDQAEAESATLRGLAACFNADNSLRLDLETYAIGAMFDQVLHSANRRLGPMTGGRYSLDRESDDSGGRARRGLGIRVFDVYTGKPRQPVTLSGGETFIAALALALGLSDVVESVSGKVHLDTIFIDEGFGSLDTNNESGTLDQVLQVLTNLAASQRRSVGLISHVPLVQEAIPNGFYVRKEVRGSRIETRGGN